MRNDKIILHLVLIFLLSIFAPSPFNAQAREKINLVASFSILADIAEQIGGDRINVESLIGPEADGHSFEPRPSDIQKLLRSDFILINGLGFEGWSDRLAASISADNKLIVASKDITPLSDHHDHTHGASHDVMKDPHAWQDVENVRLYARTIASALIGADPDHKTFFEDNLHRYDARLVALDQKIRATISSIPPERRKLVTTHDAFAYFEKAYGIDMIAPLGIAPEAQPSAKDVAAIIAKIRAEHIPALCLETINDPRLIEQIAAETGAKIAGTLYSDTLSQKNGPAGTYIAMMETNIKTLNAALAP